MKTLLGKKTKEPFDIEKLFSPFIHKLQQKWELRAVILFGSRSRGDFTPTSDYDIIIIANFYESYFKRGDQILELLPPVPIDFFTYTPIEFQRMFLEGNLTAIDAIKDGVALYDTGYLDPFVRKYKILQKLGIKVHPSSILLPDLPDNEKSIDSFM